MVNESRILYAPCMQKAHGIMQQSIKIPCQQCPYLHDAQRPIGKLTIRSAPPHKHCCLQVFELMEAGLSVAWTSHDGAHVTGGTKFGTVQGSARALLTAERIALNFLQRMSGIATATAAMVAQLQVNSLFALPRPVPVQPIV